jgi:undecaprenyl-diphosphatase
MKKNGKCLLYMGIGLLILFAVWTWLIQVIDVRVAGQTETTIGFAALNVWFHDWTGVHMPLYVVTDWLGLVPLIVCLWFFGIGVTQWVVRRSLFQVDLDIIFLGIYYALVVSTYLVFEMIPINYRPVLIDGARETSYPSSTTLLVLSVMPTLKFQIDRRSHRSAVRTITTIFVILFSVFMAGGRMIAGVHWLSDIIGSVLLSAGLFLLYRAAVLFIDSKERKKQ